LNDPCEGFGEEAGVESGSIAVGLTHLDGLVFGEEESWFAVDTLVLSPGCQKVLKHALVFYQENFEESMTPQNLLKFNF
jgi:hypothetical protein